MILGDSGTFKFRLMRVLLFIINKKKKLLAFNNKLLTIVIDYDYECLCTRKSQITTENIIKNVLLT